MVVSPGLRVRIRLKSSRASGDRHATDGPREGAPGTGTTKRCRDPRRLKRGGVRVSASNPEVGKSSTDNCRHRKSGQRDGGLVEVSVGRSDD